MSFRASRFVGPLAVALAFVACGGATFTSTKAAEPVLIAKSESPAEVRAAIVRAMQSRRFSALGEEPGKISARLDKGDITLDVDIEYSGTQYVVRYVKSSGLKTKPGPAGEVLVDDHWAGWVKGLRARIGEELLVPAKEAAETAKREREYQLLLEQHKTAQAQANAQAAQAQSQPAQPSAPGNPVPIQPTMPMVQQPEPGHPGPPPGLIPNIPTLPVPMPPVPAGTINLSHSSFTCCINGAYYVCPNQEAFKKCARLGPNECTRDTSKSCK
ncbi:MAG: hypothetical protein U0183_08520 [Polyangiaceae bacterium]